MLGSEAVARIARGVGFRTNVADQALDYLKEAQRYYEMGRTLPWFLLVEDASLTLSSGVASVALPTSFIRLYEDEPLRYTNVGETEPVRIIRKGFQDAIEAYADSEKAGPKVYILRSKTIQFFPVPNKTYTLTWSYYAKDAVIALSTENIWLKNTPELLIGEAGMRLAADLRDDAAQKRFSSMRDESYLALFKEIVLREVEDRRLAMGSDV